MIKNILLITILFASFTSAGQNTGESRPVRGSNYDKTNGWISNHVDKNVSNAGWYLLRDIDGKADSIYVLIIRTKEDQDMFFLKYKEFAAINRGWLVPRIGSKIWFTKEEYYSYKDGKLFKTTTATDAACGNGLELRMLKGPTRKPEAVITEIKIPAKTRTSSAGEGRFANASFEPENAPAISENSQKDYMFYRREEVRSVQSSTPLPPQNYLPKNETTVSKIGGLETIGLIFIGAGILAGGYALYHNWNRGHSSSNGGGNPNTEPIVEPHHGTGSGKKGLVFTF